MFDKPTPWPVAVGLACVMMVGGWWLEIFRPDPPEKMAENLSAVQQPVKPPPPELTEAQKAEEARRKALREEDNRRAARDLAVLQQLKSSMKNPASFDIDSALRMEDGSLCVSYRATNSFNAVVPNDAVITESRIVTSENKAFRSEWKKRCAGKSGVNVRGLRWFL